MKMMCLSSRLLLSHQLSDFENRNNKTTLQNKKKTMSIKMLCTMRYGVCGMMCVPFLWSGFFFFFFFCKRQEKKLWNYELACFFVIVVLFSFLFIFLMARSGAGGLFFVNGSMVYIPLVFKVSLSVAVENIFLMWWCCCL